MDSPDKKSAIPILAHLSRKPEHPDVTEEMICELVHAFYGHIQQDDVLGPVFAATIHDWNPHLDRMCDFWSSVMLKTGRFKGSPMQKHKALEGLTPELFAHWLRLFRKTAHEITPDDVANAFIAKAEMIAGGLQNGLFFKPENIAPENIAPGK